MILASIRATVVFPEPLSPTTAVTREAARLMETSSTALSRARRENTPLLFLTQKYLVR
jgi:hypothetical protein